MAEEARAGAVEILSTRRRWVPLPCAGTDGPDRRRHGVHHTHGSLRRNAVASPLPTAERGAAGPAEAVQLVLPRSHPKLPARSKTDCARPPRHLNASHLLNRGAISAARTSGRTAPPLWGKLCRFVSEAVGPRLIFLPPAAAAQVALRNPAVRAASQYHNDCRFACKVDNVTGQSPFSSWVPSRCGANSATPCF